LLLVLLTGTLSSITGCTATQYYGNDGLCHECLDGLVPDPTGTTCECPSGTYTDAGTGACMACSDGYYSTDATCSTAMPTPASTRTPVSFALSYFDTDTMEASSVVPEVISTPRFTFVVNDAPTSIHTIHFVLTLNHAFQASSTVFEFTDDSLPLPFSATGKDKEGRPRFFDVITPGNNYTLMASAYSAVGRDAYGATGNDPVAIRVVSFAVGNIAYPARTGLSVIIGMSMLLLAMVTTGVIAVVLFKRVGKANPAPVDVPTTVNAMHIASPSAGNGKDTADKLKTPILKSF